MDTCLLWFKTFSSCWVSGEHAMAVLLFLGLWFYIFESNFIACMLFFAAHTFYKLFFPEAPSEHKITIFKKCLNKCKCSSTHEKRYTFPQSSPFPITTTRSPSSSPAPPITPLPPANQHIPEPSNRWLQGSPEVSWGREGVD